ncbi:uncharacterized protein PITG_10724 [Phytophthora infestans T30-4]|uniref:Calmodulin n=1 Tax=Phytophthora infestans (strain T30-4) TaxID=403677 RepID=D0NGX8_PHYIT|nr:uncharacterized protein PITG_10724 [Phytophthora infestans T30-4]EEY58617.1 conserved hypothetical protein [Phytophthora infestans T30-4]|eukprot:XP_002901561.1 conserved hypothetical protein [Phytophthora infestans T30-4]
MGIRNTRPLPLASEELMLAPFFKRRFRSWHLEHVRLALQRYRLLTPRFCVDALQLSTILGIKEKKLVDDVMRLFLPRTPTRVQCMVDVMEILIALVLVCQAPSMLQRFELIFDIVDLEARGAISTTDLIMLCGAVGRAIMKLFEYTVKPEQQAAMAYTTDVLDSLGGSRNDSISKEMLCKFMVSDRFAVHYTKQCTGEDKPKLYIMLEKNSEFLGAVEFSSEQHMQATSLRTVRDMIYTQVHRVPEDFSFLCQGRELNKVWEVDRRAWSVVPFALRGSPGLRADILARNRGLQRPKAVNAFEFRYMGNLITRYKKSIHDIKPVYKHHAFRLRGKAPRKHLEAAVEWRVATTWSGEWMYEQQRVRSTTRPGILKALRASARPQQGVLVVKSHFGEILSSSSMDDTANGDKEWDQRHSTQLEGTPSTPPQPERRMQRIVSLSLRERKREDKLRKQRMQWKARLIAMEAQHQTEKNVTTVLVHIEEDNILPSRLVRCEPKKRRRPKKSEWKTWRWGVPGRLLSSLPPRRKMMKASKISDDICLAPPPGTSTNQELGLGKFLSSTNIFLEDDEVEVFPVLIIRPLGEQVCVLEKPLFANKAYLTEFEYEISARESNYEALYQHVGSGLLQDAIWLNRRDACGRTMLHDAAEFGHANVMELLLKARVLVDVKDSGGDTPLHHAARNGRLKEVVILLRERATPWLPNAEGKSPLYLIDLLWNNYKVEDLVRKDGYDRTNCVELEKEVYGDMIQACHDGNLLRVQKLVELDKRSVLQFINEQMEILQRTALHEAAEQGHTATVNLLVKLGADGFLTDQRLQVPLHLAAWKGFDKIAKCLVTKFPQTAAYQDIAGCTPLHLAVQQKHWGIAADLICAIQARGDVIVHCLNLHDIHGYTALHYACIHGNFKICKALVSAGATTTTLRCEYRVPAGSPHLLGRWWKGNVKRVGKRKSLMKEADQIKVFDVEAAELVVQGCKQNFSNYQERLAMLELLFNLENVDDSSREKPTPVRMATSPVFHIAAQLADINISIAVEMCRQLHKLQVEINMPHPRTGETVLLQECKRICRVAKNCSGMSSQYADGAMDQLALVRCLLELGANVDLANEVNGESPLGCAAWYGHLALLDLLLEAGADKDKFLRQCSFSPLHFAALGNNVVCAKMLISSSATVNVEMPPTNAETPLYFAIRSKSAEMVDLLLRSNADPCSPCTVQQGCSSFGVIFSLPDGCISRAEEGASTEHQGVGTARIVASPLTFGLLVSQSLKECRLPKELSCTVERSRRQTQWEDMKSICTMIAKRLLEVNGGSKGIVTRGDILLACAMGFWELVQLLLTQQISLSNAPSVFGMNALHLAAAAGQTKVVTALVAGGMNVNCITRSDSSKPQRSEGRRSWYEWSGCGHRGALFYALIHGHAETAAKLLVLGAKAEQTPGMSSTNMPTETIIHIAISYGHLTMVEYFAKLAQNSFPGSLHREGKVFKSLLVTACEAHQIQILRFLLKHDGVDGGGFTYSECRDEFQSALCTCATFQFVEGFEVLIQCGARPDVNTLHRSSFSFPGKRRPHDFRSNSVGIATKLLELVLSSNFMDDIDEFLGPSPVYELMFKILVICSRNGLWFVLDELFILHQDSFVDATSIWKPVLVRAAISCLVLHRAAMDNQVNLVAFFLRLGAPADLRLGKTRPTKCPIWYAGSRGSLEAFLCLALHSETFARDLELDALRKFDFTFLPLVFRSIDESRGTLSTSNTTCRWQNLSAFSCIELPKRHTNGLLIQKFVNYGLLISRGHSDTSLLHHASRRGELIAVQALVKAGADLTETNQNGVTPLEIASGRKDGFGLSIVRHLIAAIAQQKLSSAATIIDRALIRCFAQESPYALRIAQALLNAGASPRFSCNATEKEANVCGFARISAMFFAMKTANSAGVRLLVDHGAAITVGLSEVFLAQFVIAAQHPVKRHWRRFSKYLKQSNGRKLLLDIETIMKTLLEKEVFPTAVNADLVLQMLTSASAMAATIAHAVDDSKRFWGIADTILDKFPKEASSRTAEWNQKAALHYAVASLELPIVAKLAKLRGFDLLAQDENKQTSLHLAAVGGDETICRVLLEKLHSNTVKATAIDAQDSRGRTALHLAVIHGHETIASMIVAAGASLDVRCREGLTALLYAAKCNRLAILIALFSRAQPKPHNALLTVHQEAGIFVAARSGAFSVVRWFLNLYENESKTDAHNTTVLNGRRTMFNMQCSDERTVLHYAAIYGNEETLQQLKVTEDGVKSGLVDVVNARDKFGYTSLMYAIAFGRLRVVRSLCELGADPFTSIDHSGDPGAHPYTTGFDIAGLLQWFALPGWYSFACKYLSPQEKMSLVRSTSIYDDYLRHSSYTKRKKRDKPPVEWRTQIRTSMRSWRFPYKSIFDYACEIGNAQIVDFLVSLRLPQTFRGLTYQAQRRNFMQAVRWNRLEIVKTLITSAAGSIVIESTTGNHFMNFLETGIECAVSRGLEDMAIYLVDKWQGIMENGRDGATPSAFAFQFAPAFQVACIRRMSRLMERMIERGGEEIIEFHLNEGPALVYAFAFGYVEIADLLLRNGADPAMATATYSAPSIRKWVEFGRPKSAVLHLWDL